MTAPTTRTLEDVQREYNALENKRSPEGHALREEMKMLKGGDAPAAHVASTADLGPGFVAVERPEVLVPDFSGEEVAEKGAVYWCGITPLVRNYKDPNAPRPPFTSKTFAGITFTSAETPWEGGASANPDHKRGFYPGSIVRITEAKLTRFKDILRRSVVRWHSRTGRHAHGYVVTFETEDTIARVKKHFGLTDAEVARYREKTRLRAHQPTDEPLGKYLYCVKLSNQDVQEGSSFRPSGDLPPNVIDAGGIAAP